MSVTTSTNAGVTSVVFTYKAATSQVVRIADQAAHYLYDCGYGDHTKLFSALTNVDKLAILDQYLIQVLMDARYAQDATDGDAAKKAVIDAAHSEPPLTII
jgi:hypothetical protein